MQIQRRRVLKFAKVKRMDSERGRRRSQRALKRSEVAQLLDVWAADPRLVGIRNHALLRLMIYTGLRRAEIVTLRWDDIDLENQTVTVRHGKGDKRRIAAIADVTEATKRALLALWQAQAGAYDCLFPTMTAGRNPKFEADEPMSAQTIVRLLSRSSKRAAIGHLSAHDLRRTHITLALDNGAPLQDMQAQAGHANPSTTLRYAQPSDAKIAARADRFLRGKWRQLVDEKPAALSLAGLDLAYDGQASASEFREKVRKALTKVNRRSE